LQKQLKYLIKEEAVKCQINIDNRDFNFEVDGKFFWGKNEVLYNQEKLSKKTMPWKEKGFLVSSFFEQKELDEIKHSLRTILINLLREKDIEVDSEKFIPEKYHQWATTDEIHQHVISKTRNLTEKDFAIDLPKVSQRVSDLVGEPIDSYIPALKSSYIILRISRPKSLDINPLHRDGYLDFWRDILNLWIPLWGCNEKSILPLIPGSHLWNESEVYRTECKGAKINGLVYNVPAIIKIKNGIKLMRPELKSGESILFTPFLIHGAALNANEDITRLSLELRLRTI